jgi:hypothetical protein
MSHLPIILSCALLVPSLIQHDAKAWLSFVRKTETVVIAEVVEVNPSPGFWSGFLASVQHVKYKVVEVLKGEVQSKEIDAGHYVVKNSVTADKEKARLSPELFKPGNRLILILSREEGHGCKLNNPKGDIEAFCSDGSVIASPKLVDMIRSDLKGK